MSSSPSLCCSFNGLLLLLISAASAYGQTASLRPLTDRILLLHVDDGYVIHHGPGQSGADDRVVQEALNPSLAQQVATYTLHSPDDPRYAAPLHPLKVGRKSKGTEFAGLCESWGTVPYFQATGCLNTSPDHAKEHWIYLFLPQSLETGKTYQLSTDGLFRRIDNEFTFTYHPQRQHSEAVHVNQIGYVPDAPQKFGYVYAWLGDEGSLDLLPYAGRPFHLIDTLSEAIAFSGTLRFRQHATARETGQANETPNDNFLGAEVYECDFSDFGSPGHYRLYVEGVGSSFPFAIGEDVLREPFHYVMRGMYQNRSGITLEGDFAQERPAPHNVRQTPGFAGKLIYTTTTWCEASNRNASENDKSLWEAGFVGPLTDTWGWYQDAGDWDAYLRHMQVPTNLLFLFEHQQEQFTDGELAIPESGNGHPDILDEARWLLRFYKRLKDELVAKGWGSGGVGGARIMGDLWGGDAAPDGGGRGSWADTTRTWVVSGEEAFTTFWYAGVAAHYAYCLELAGLEDVEGIDWQAEAEAAYDWALAQNSSPESCHNYSLRHLRMYAAASLYKLTGEGLYQVQFINDFRDEGITSDERELWDEQAYGIWQYLSLPEGVSAQLSFSEPMLGAVRSTADFQLLFSSLQNRACRWGGNFWSPMVVGQGTTPLVDEGIMAYFLLRDRDPAKAYEYKRVLHNTADYFLGNNPLNTTWITGLGERSPVGLFHLDSWYSPSGGVRTGIVPYGPWRLEDYAPYGPWRNDWAALTTYPDIRQWPGHERWFDQRLAPRSCEFTLDQTNLFSALLYGALSTQRTSTALASYKQPEAALLKLSPNPAREQLHIDAPGPLGPEAYLVDALGRRQVVAVRNGIISLTGLRPGVYLLSLQDASGLWRSGRFVKR